MLSPAVPAPRRVAPAAAAAQRLLLVLATLATGLAAGFFYAYEVSVTRGLARVDDDTYVETMQAINATVRNLPFALSFFGALLLTAAALAARARAWRQPATWLVAAGLLLYAAAFAVTFGFNVPLNDELEAVDRATADLAAARTDYESDWNDWNLTRTLASFGAFVALALALLLEHRDGRRRLLD